MALWVSSQESFGEYGITPPFVPPPCASFIKKNKQKIVNRLKLNREKKRKNVMTQVKEKVNSTILYPKRYWCGRIQTIAFRRVELTLVPRWIIKIIR
jgi:hypothetical protein